MWEPVSSTGSISTRIEKQVVALVTTEQLRPGDQLPPERELAGLLGVSRPSVREAVKSLQAQGLLHVRHGQGVFVAAPLAERNLRSSLREQEITLAELYAMREVLEVPATGWTAAAADEDFLAAAATALEELNAAASRDLVDYAELGELDARFHMLIVASAGNRFLQQTLGVLQEIIASGMRTTLGIPGRIERSREDHERIMAALRAGDAAAARRAARAHIRGAHKAAMQRLADERARSESARIDGARIDSADANGLR